MHGSFGPANVKRRQKKLEEAAKIRLSELNKQIVSVELQSMLHKARSRHKLSNMLQGSEKYAYKTVNAPIESLLTETDQAKDTNRNTSLIQMNQTVG